MKAVFFIIALVTSMLVSAAPSHVDAFNTNNQDYAKLFNQFESKHIVNIKLQKETLNCNFNAKKINAAHEIKSIHHSAHLAAHSKTKVCIKPVTAIAMKH